MVACILDAMMKAREASFQWMIFIVTPAAALLASVAMTTFLPQGILLFSLLFLAFFHYYWEGVMWKNGSPHRKNIYV